MARSSFAKLQRDRDKRAKAAAKRERRQNRDETDEEGTDDEVQAEPMSEENTEKLLAQIAQLHEQFEDGQIPFETFEETKAELMARLPVD